MSRPVSLLAALLLPVLVACHDDTPGPRMSGTWRGIVGADSAIAVFSKSGGWDAANATMDVKSPAGAVHHFRIDGTLQTVEIIGSVFAQDGATPVFVGHLHGTWDDTSNPATLQFHVDATDSTSALYDMRRRR